MIWLTIVFCLANSIECREKQDFEPFMMPMACVVAAQQAAAEWLRTHPAYVLHEAPSVPMTMRHRPPGSLALRVLKDDLAHAHDPDPDQR
jgi:hypothetical protein